MISKFSKTIFAIITLLYVLNWAPSISQTSNASIIWLKVYGVGSISNLTFGNHEGNTFGADTDTSIFPKRYLEQEPPPPSPGFDCIWKPIRVGQFGRYRGLLDKDFRAWGGSGTVDTFKLSFVQADNASATISFQWPDPSYLSSRCTNLLLTYTDPVAGPIIIDMFTQDTLILPFAGDRAISQATIYKSGIPIDETREESGLASPRFALLQNYPNPFNPLTLIRYQLLASGHATMKVYDLMGREIATLVNETKPPGNCEATWDASRVASGVYYYRLQAGRFVETKKMVLLR